MAPHRPPMSPLHAPMGSPQYYPASPQMNPQAPRPIPMAINGELPRNSPMPQPGVEVCGWLCRCRYARQ